MIWMRWKPVAEGWRVIDHSPPNWVAPGEVARHQCFRKCERLIPIWTFITLSWRITWHQVEAARLVTRDPEILITAVIPTYRRPHLLRRAITSVLTQESAPLQVCVYDNA